MGSNTSLPADISKYEEIQILPRWAYTDEEFVFLIESIDLVDNKKFYTKIIENPDDLAINELLDI